MHADSNGLGHFPYVKKLEDIFPPEVMLVSQTISYIGCKIKGLHHRLKGQCVLAPQDLKNIQTTLSRNCNGGHAISEALKRRWTYKSAYHK